MDSEIELISDGDGVAVIGAPTDVEAFLTSHGLNGKELGLQRLGPKLATAAGVTQAGSTIAATSGRWLLLADESAAAMQHLPTVVNSSTGLFHGTLRASNGQFAKSLQFVDPKSLAYLASPAVLAGAAGLMAQLAMQAQMDEIQDYLAVIDEKLDDVLRAQKDAVFADMIGVGLVLEEAMTVRGEVGRVSEVTWSKVQAMSQTIARTQAYALRQLDALADKVDQKAKIGEVAAATKDAEAKVQEWLAVLARCFQLQDAHSVLELDRVLDASPEDLDQHRLGLRTARQNRLDLIFRSTEQLLDRMNTAGARANGQVLLHPLPAKAALSSSNRVAVSVVDFQRVLGIDDGHDSPEAKRWLAAVVETKDKVIETGTDGAEAAMDFGNEAIDRAKSTANRLAGGFRAFRQAVRENGDDRSE
ncbi:hypothetical protein SAMN04487783_0480 [Agrococcus baldri]|uniref:Uncharacterized protein n=1 Tax=Agrococcus baldri TaxID=153730 RepID=A0AA94HKK6_9MICO|nr:hypothetical protein [Agrococcus baldri]SFS00733.1 hypothetical protein SAMN04487783_0480 [Agrococcus baldri]